MESKIQANETEITDAQQRSELEVETTQGGQIEKISVNDSTTTGVEWQEWAKPVSDFLSDLPENISQFFSDYKKPLITVGIVFGGFVAVKVTLSVLDAVNDIPLLAPLFELVGIGYTGWFVFRYLLKSSTRRELTAEFDSLKKQYLGENPQ
ncbi:MAG: CAAD domain-containing protein [Oscillatoria sp. PMC 1068.18]|nr:CAAD domain-containing protein [Oscillatoria sp. PMC 1076.18]MEC4989085.1 CAAD domain-containing protein [Oscillatoria sp. PMC 1068.18]